MREILLLEDDTTLGRGIQLALQGPDVTIALTGTLSQAREMLAQKKFDLLILDVNLPDGSALDLLREVRQGEAVPVILLTANDLEMDVVTGLESGADDYITKPFSLAILRARVNAQLRRRVKFSCVELDGFRFDFERMAFWKNGEPIELSKTEQKLLRLLVENRGQTVSRGTLVDRIWTDGADFVDEYHGKQVPAGKKSVTIRLTIGSLEKTLTSTEIEECASGVIKKLTKRLGAELRTR